MADGGIEAHGQAGREPLRLLPLHLQLAQVHARGRRALKQLDQLGALEPAQAQGTRQVVATAHRQQGQFVIAFLQRTEQRLQRAIAADDHHALARRQGEQALARFGTAVGDGQRDAAQRFGQRLCAAGCSAAGAGIQKSKCCHMERLYWPPTSNKALVIWPSEQHRTASISTSKTLPFSITACCRRASSSGA